MNIKQPGDILFFKIAATISPRGLLANVGLDLLEEKLPESIGRGIKETRKAPSRLKETASSWFSPFLPAKKEEEPTVTLTHRELQEMIDEIMGARGSMAQESPQLGLPVLDQLEPSPLSSSEKTSSHGEDQPIKSEEDLVTAMKRMSLQLAKYTPKMKYRQTAGSTKSTGARHHDQASDFYVDDETMPMGPSFVLTPPFLQI